MSQWGSSDSGILRKNRVDENLDSLLVFGYSCKVFRDDEKAIYIDQGKHLIPWMGDETLKIDRYDGRGALPDLRRLEASREGYDNLRWMGLSESEKKLEELCDSERYYSLEINEEEEEMYKEEAAKRRQTNAFAFDYNNPQPQEPVEAELAPTVAEKEEEDEPYKPLPILDVPVDINMPNTVKEYARIEKTAWFVCRQGLQMEILIKAKQADNPQFNFLMVNDPLYKFYRHVLSAFKNGRYQPQCNTKPDEPKVDVSLDDDPDAHYLHPSLQSSSGKPATPPPQNPPIPSVPYRPSADCAYSQLVNRIQGNSNGQSGEPAQVGATGQQQGVAPTQAQQMSLEQQYHQYYYVQQFFEYWRHSVVNSEQGAMYAGLPMNFSQLDPNMQSYIHQLAWAQFMQHHQKQMQEAQQAQASANNNPYAQIVSNVNKDTVNPYTANVPILPPPEPAVVEQPKVVPTEVKSQEERKVTLVKYDENEVKKPLLSLAAAYGSASDTDSDSSDSETDSKASENQDPQPQETIEVYRAPSGELQTVIDKMAEYVSKNGEQFEEIIKQKGEARFDFLNQGHEFNKYYRAKLRELRGEPEVKEVRKVQETKPPKVKTKKVIAPVSFSIKKPKDEAPKDIKNALPMEDSSEEESYLDNLPKSPPNSGATKITPSATTTNSQSLAQMVNPKQIYKIGQPVVSNLPQPKVAHKTVVCIEDTVSDTVSSNGNMLSPPKDNGLTLKKRASPSDGGCRLAEASPKMKSPRKRRSKSRSLTPPKDTYRSRTPKKRSRSPTKSPVPPKRAKSRSKTPSSSTRSPARTKTSPVTISLLSPIEEQKVVVRTKKKSSSIDMFDMGDGDGQKKKSVKTASNGILQQDDPILEMLELERDEMNAEENAAADAKEKARQLERKRKAAMFLKLKYVDTKFPTTAKTEKPSPAKAEKSIPTKSEKSLATKSEKRSGRSPLSRTSRRNSDDSVITIRSRSRTREKSKLKEKPPFRNKSRSRSKESTRSARRSRSRDRRKDSKKHKKNRERSRSKDREEEERRRKREKKKKSHKSEHKSKHSKSRKKSKKHKRSRSSSKSRSRSRSKSSSRSSKSRSSSVKSHISIDSS